MGAIMEAEDLNLGQKKEKWMSRAIVEELKNMGYEVDYPANESYIFGSHRMAPPGGSYGAICVTQHEKFFPQGFLPSEDHSVSLFVGYSYSDCQGEYMRGLLDSVSNGFRCHMAIEKVIEEIAAPFCYSRRDRYRSEHEREGRIEYPYVHDFEKEPEFARFYKTPRQWAELLVARFERFEQVFPIVIERRLPEFFSKEYGAVIDTLHKQMEKEGK